MCMVYANWNKLYLWLYIIMNFCGWLCRLFVVVWFLGVFWVFFLITLKIRLTAIYANWNNYMCSIR